MSRFYVSWRKSTRTLFYLPFRTHCHVLPIIANCVPIECQIACRTVKVIKNTLSGQNSHAKLLMNMVIQGSQSTVSKTVNYILEKYHLTHMMFHTESIGSIIYK